MRTPDRMRKRMAARLRRAQSAQAAPAPRRRVTIKGHLSGSQDLRNARHRHLAPRTCVPSSPTRSSTRFVRQAETCIRADRGLAAARFPGAAVYALPTAADDPPTRSCRSRRERPGRRMTMNPQISRSLADEHISDLRRQAARYAAAAPRDRDRSRAPRLRRRIGLVMIDAGSRMLATTPARDHR